MDRPTLWRDVLRELRLDIVRTISDQVVLSYLLDHLISKHCIEGEHKEQSLAKELRRERAGCLLDVIDSQNEQAFHEFCNALAAFKAGGQREMADKLRQRLCEKQIQECKRCKGE
jgi:Caspase recruitment domain